MPKFGPLAGLRVVFSGIEIAGPFAGQMFAEWGAEVIWIENVAWADTIRVQPNYPQLSRRNLHALSLNIFKDEGREAFLKLMETTDIFIEASKGPAFARRGITDEVLWQHKPETGYRSPVRFWSSTAPRSTPIFRPITPSPRPSVVT
ncbi:crotonobetainyl-CoA:carnitine CoA-transferase [Escherichia coli]|uniref:Crotonobetainyl-CoA:carnitine CoA-transferase n=1 Tax=Escherichia coli TaxID=562 RepID=A0A377E420_ECOLX|nr:crotonobetainyl-CoA:carnitine CoA-transferase [Escherichia coli]